MKESSILIEFDVQDMSASYEVYGTSKNYSFKENLGRGSNLVFNEGDTYSHVIGLKGNYGEFEVRVFCVSDIGIKSEALLGNIVVAPPEFEGTFTITNLMIETENSIINSSREITQAADNFGDTVEVSQKFGERNFTISWQILPPGGHEKEGSPVSSDILDDPFFSHFEFKIFDDSGNIVNLNNSVALQSLLGSANVNQVLSEYREFRFTFSEALFEDLNLTRDLRIEVKCKDTKGGSSFGYLNLYNPVVDIGNLIYELNGNTVQFSWNILDIDYIGSDIKYFAIPDKYEIYDEDNFESNVDHFNSIVNAETWTTPDFSDTVVWNQGDIIIYNARTYECLQTYSANSSSNTPNYDSLHWEEIYDSIVPFLHEEISVEGNSLVNYQLWGYKYFYSITPKDFFGSGVERYISEGGNFGSSLAPFTCKIAIDNFRGIEQGDSFLFNWDFVDAYGNKTDLNQYRFTFAEQEVPSVLGVAGYLYDLDSGEQIKSISDEVVSKTLERDEDGYLGVEYKLSNAAIFNSYEYTRELNNSLYGTEYGAGGGKRSIGLEISLIDNQLNVINDPLRIEVDNPPPNILSAGFRQGVDSTSEASKVKFNFNYALGIQEKTTKVYLYRIPDYEVETYDEDGNVLSRDFSSFTHLDSNGLPDTRTPAQGGYFVQRIEGPGDATYGDNITQIVDTPPSIDQSIEGFYYKILPFDDFGSGVLFNVPYGEGDPSQTLQKVVVYPRNLSSTDTTAPPGKVLRSDPTFAAGAIPGPPKGFNGTTAFENYFLNWGAPQSDFDPNDPGKLLTWTENDVDHYEVWISDDEYLKLNGQQWLSAENTGYRRVDGVAYSVGEIPKEIQDPARNISNANNIFNVPANAPSIETSYPGTTRETKNFWVRAVDFAGNKSSFTDSNSPEEGIQGLKLTLGTATATDIDDFEISMTSGFADSIALVPNNPFKDSNDGSISWDEHILYNDGTGYIVNAGSTSDGYVWWDRNDSSNDLNLTSYKIRINGNEETYAGQAEGLLEEFNYNDDPWEGVKNVYFKGLEYKTSNSHPSNNPVQNDEHISDNQNPSAPENSISLTVTDFDDGDFIIARNTNGVVTPVHQAFANALIGTANIAEAAIKTAHIHDLSADKITAGQIKGHRIEVFNQGDGIKTPLNKPGSIGSTDFTDLVFQEGKDLLDPNTEGFVLSGDGSFAFQQGLNSLSFEEGELMLRGRMKQKNNKDYDFVEINPSPRYFSYIENDEGFQPIDGFDAVDSNGISDEVARLHITFRNSSIKGAQDIEVKAVRLLHGGEEENIFVIANDPDPNVTNDGWLKVTELSAYQDDYGFRWANDYIQAFDQGPGVFSTSVLLPVYVTNSRASYHSLVQTNSEVYQDTILLYARSVHSDIQKQCVITRLVDGKGSESIRLSSSSQVFKVKKDFTSDLAEIEITADTQGNNQRIKWNSSTVPLYDQNGNVLTQNTYGGHQKVKVKFSDFVNTGATPRSITHALSTITATTEEGKDLYNNPASPSISDEISIFVLEEGSDSITSILSNENHNFHFEERYEYIRAGKAETPATGSEYDGSGTDIQVWEGVSPLTFTTVSLSAGKFKVTASPSQLGGVNEISPGAINSVSGASAVARVADHSSVYDAASTIYIDYTITGRTFSDKEFTIVKRQTFSVTRDGDTAKSLSIFADSYIFSKHRNIDQAGSLSPAYIKISAEKKNISENVNWSHTNSSSLALFRSSTSDSTASSTHTGNDVWVKRDDFWALSVNEVKITATCSRSGMNNSSDNFTVSDNLTISKVEEGSNAIQPVLTNASHSLAEKNESGDFDYTSSGTELIVYDGSLRLKPVTGTLAAGQFKVDTVTVTEGTITYNGVKSTNNSDANTYSIVYNNFSNMPASVFEAKVRYNISYKKYGGETGSTSIEQTISKSIAGTSVDIVFARGTTAPTITANGANTPSGWYTDADNANLQGDNKGFLWASRGEKRAGETAYTWKTPFRVEGEAVAEVRLYKKVANNGVSGTAPTSTYDFTNNSIVINTTDANAGWQKNIPSISNNSDVIYESAALFSAPQNKNNASATWSSPAKTAHKLDGISTEYWFQASSSSSTAPSKNNTGTNPGTNWKSNLGSVTELGYVWAIKGVSVEGTTTGQYNFGTPYRLEGDVAAEVIVYKKVANGVAAPGGPSGITYNFAENKVVVGSSGWSLTIPDITNGERVYASAAIFSSYKNNAASGTNSDGWSTPWVTAKRKDGVATSYRGDWSSNGSGVGYFGTDYRGDIIKYNGNYYICVDSHTRTTTNPETPGTSDKWEPFGAEFSSVATGLLLAEDGYIASKLEVGEGGVGGVLRSHGFQGGLFNSDTRQPRTTDDYEPAGYLLATDFENNTTIAYFDVGGINPRASSTNTSETLSYIRYSSAKGKVEIKGTFINNAIIDTGFGYTGSGSLSGYINNMIGGGQIVDELGSFVGGGYNNVFVSDPVNTVDNIASLIAGGAENQMSSHFASIGGGYGNICKDNFSVIAGGFENTMPAEEAGNIQGSNGILTGIENSISGGSNQTILNGTKNTITQTTLLSQTGTAGEARLDDIHSSISTGYWKYGVMPITVLEGNWISGSWFPGMFIDNMQDAAFFAQSFCLIEEWIYSSIHGWAFVYWARDNLYNRSVYLRDFSVSLDLWAFFPNWGTKSGWYFINPDTYFNFAPDYGLMYNDGEEAWYYIRRTSGGDTQVYKEGSGPWVTVN